MYVAEVDTDPNCLGRFLQNSEFFLFRPGFGSAIKILWKSGFIFLWSAVSGVSVVFKMPCLKIKYC